MRTWVVRDPITNKAKFVGGVYRIAAQGNYLTNVICWRLGITSTSTL